MERSRRLGCASCKLNALMWLCGDGFDSRVCRAGVCFTDLDAMLVWNGTMLQVNGKVGYL